MAKKVIRFTESEFNRLVRETVKREKRKSIQEQNYFNPEVYGMTIGNFVKGRYKAKDGSLYDETSLSVEIIGVSSNVLNKVAEELAKEFKQETVLVKNYDDNRIYLVK